MKPKNEISNMITELSKKRNKYNAQKTVVDGITFDSKKEANYYKTLKLGVETMSVHYFLRQVPFDLPGNVKYRVDFMVVNLDGSIDYIDVKGRKTPIYILKKKQVEALYPIKITEV